MEPIYANLPGIAKGEPDIYESEDCPQFDETYNKTEELSEDIEFINLDAMSTINRFQTRHLDGFNPDVLNRINTGYRSTYDICTKGQVESPQQKLTRLKLEINELSLQVKENKIEMSDSATFIDDLQEAQNRIQNIAIENRVPSLNGESISNVNLPMQRNPSQAKNDSTRSSSNNSDQSQKVDAATTKHIARLQNLDVRLNKAELLLGAATSNSAQSQSHSDDPSLSTVKGALDTLNRRLSLLDNDVLCQLQERMQRACDLASSSSPSTTTSSTATQQSLDKINSPSSGGSTTTTTSGTSTATAVSVQRLYDQFEQFKGFSTDLPMFLERLNSLKIVHDKAGQYSDTMSNITLTQKTITSDLELEKNIYSQVTENVEKNIKIIKDSCSRIEKRIEDLQ